MYHSSVPPNEEVEPTSDNVQGLQHAEDSQIEDIFDGFFSPYFEENDSVTKIKHNQRTESTDWCGALERFQKANGERAQLDALTQLGSMANVKSNTHDMRNAGVIPVLTSFLASAETYRHPRSVVAEAVYCLRNLACANGPNRDALREEGAIPVLVHLVQNCPMELHEEDENPPKDTENESSMWPGSEEPATAACGALRNMSFKNLSNQRAIWEAGGVEALLRWVKDIPPGGRGREAAFRAAHAVCNVCQGCPQSVPLVVESQKVPTLLQLMCKPGSYWLWHGGVKAILNYGEKEGLFQVVSTNDKCKCSITYLTKECQPNPCPVER